MRSILSLTETILRNKFTCNYLKNQKNFLTFFLQFWNLDYILNIIEENLTLIAYVFPKLWTRKDAFR